MTYISYELKLTALQKRQILETFDACNQMFNYLINLRKDHYKETRELYTVNELRDILASEKKISYFLRKADSAALRNVITDMPNVPKHLTPSKKDRFLNKIQTRSNVKYTTSMKRVGITVHPTLVKLPKLGDVEIISGPHRPIQLSKIDVFAKGDKLYIGYDLTWELSEQTIKARELQPFELKIDMLLKGYPILNMCKDCPQDVQRHLTSIEKIINLLTDAHNSFIIESISILSEDEVSKTYLKEFYALLQMAITRKNLKISII